MKLIERIIGEAKIVEEKQLPKGVLMRVLYPICNIGKRNHNNRKYSRKVWENVHSNPDIQEKLRTRTLFGHAEHPQETTQSNLEKTSHIVSNLYLNESDNKEYAQLDILDTPYGRIVATLLEAGCQVGVSTRAEGELREARDDEGTYYEVVPESYRFITVDFTADPSTYGAYPEKIEKNLVQTIQQGVESKKIDTEFAVALLEKCKCNEAACLLENIKKSKVNEDKGRFKEGDKVIVSSGLYKVVRYSDDIPVYTEEVREIEDKEDGVVYEVLPTGLINVELSDGTVIEVGEDDLEKKLKESKVNEEADEDEIAVPHIRSIKAARDYLASVGVEYDDILSDEDYVSFVQGGPNGTTVAEYVRKERTLYVKKDALQDTGRGIGERKKPKVKIWKERDVWRGEIKWPDGDISAITADTKEDVKNWAKETLKEKIEEGKDWDIEYALKGRPDSMFESVVPQILTVLREIFGDTPMNVERMADTTEITLPEVPADEESWKLAKVKIEPYIKNVPIKIGGKQIDGKSALLITVWESAEDAIGKLRERGDKWFRVYKNDEIIGYAKTYADFKKLGVPIDSRIFKDIQLLGSGNRAFIGGGYYVIKEDVDKKRDWSNVGFANGRWMSLREWLDSLNESYIVVWRTEEDYLGDSEYDTWSDAKEFALSLADKGEHEGHKLKSVWIENKEGKDLTGNIMVYGLTERKKLFELKPEGFKKAISPEVKPKPKILPKEIRAQIERLWLLQSKLEEGQRKLEEQIMKELGLAKLPSKEIQALRKEILDYMTKEKVATAELKDVIVKLFGRTIKPSAIEVINSLAAELSKKVLKRLYEQEEAMRRISYYLKVEARKAEEASLLDKIKGFFKGIFDKFKSWLSDFQSTVRKFKSAVDKAIVESVSESIMAEIDALLQDISRTKEEYEKHKDRVEQYLQGKISFDDLDLEEQSIIKELIGETRVDEYIRRVGDKYVVYAESGRRMGVYDTREEAEKRLKQIEMFKHMKESILNEVSISKEDLIMLYAKIGKDADAIMKELKKNALAVSKEDVEKVLKKMKESKETLIKLGERTAELQKLEEFYMKLQQSLDDTKKHYAIDVIGLTEEIRQLEERIEKLQEEKESYAAQKVEEALAGFYGLEDEYKKEIVRLREQVSSLKEELGAVKNLVEAKEAEHKKQIDELYASHQKEITDLKEQFIKEKNKAVLEKYIDCKLEFSGLKVSDDVRALLEQCETEEQVDQLLERVRTAIRESALHSGKLEDVELFVRDETSALQKKVSGLVGKALEGMGKIKKKQ